MNTIISSSVVLFTLYFLVDFIRFIPNACLAAIVIVNLFSLFSHVPFSPLSLTRSFAT